MSDKQAHGPIPEIAILEALNILKQLSNLLISYI